MAKSDIGKIITSGSIRQKLLLIADDRAREHFSYDRLLTDFEHNLIRDSFKTNNEIKLWNLYIKFDELLIQSINNLRVLIYEFLMYVQDFKGFLMVWNTLENTEQLVNLSLHELKNINKRKEVAKDISKGVYLLLGNIEIDKEGYIEIKTKFDTVNKSDTPIRKEDSLTFVIDFKRQQIEKTATKYISWEAAIIDFMNDNNINIKTYKDILKQYKSLITVDFGIYKYKGMFDPELNGNNQNIENILKKYAIIPDLSNLKVDKKEYDWFKSNFLNIDK